MELLREDGRQGFYIAAGIFSLSLLVSCVWLYFDSGFAPVIAILTSLGALAETVVIRQRLWKYAAYIFGGSVLIIGITVGTVYLMGGISRSAVTLTLRIADEEGEAIERAKVLVFHEGVPITQVADSNGVVVFTSQPDRTEAQLVVEKDDYQIYEQVISINSDQNLTVLLERKNKDQRHVIVRTVDDHSHEPLEGAKVVLIVSGAVYEDVTDSNGLSRFVIEFSEATIAAELQIVTDDYEISNNSINLQPEKVQDIRLDSIEEAVAQVTETQGNSRSVIVAAVTGGNDVITTESGTPLEIVPVSEAEPNNLPEEAQIISEIGADRPVTGRLTAAPEGSENGDQDWYTFSAVAGERYVVEVFDVANTLSLVPKEYNCGDGYKKYYGLILIVTDPSSNEVSKRCTPWGPGNVHTMVAFTAGVSGDYRFQIMSHSPNVEGGYNLRVLPKYDQPDAKWDGVTFEPNNYMENAYPIVPGRENALTSTIGHRNPAFSTTNADHDAYRFEAVAGQTYVVELFNVSSTLALKSSKYDCGDGYKNHEGLWLGIFDPFGNEVARQCTHYGTGNVHKLIQFTAGNDGFFHILIYPQEGTVVGNYGLRVLPKYDEPNASWDELSYEPNNRSANAYNLKLGSGTGVVSTIENKSTAFSTNYADQDWFYFVGEAGKTYLIELGDVSDTLTLKSVRYDCGEGHKDHTGLWLGVFDPTVNELARQCSSNGSDNVYSFIEFTASRDGEYYLLVYTHDSSVSGEYHIEVREK